MVLGWHYLLFVDLDLDLLEYNTYNLQTKVQGVQYKQRVYIEQEILKDRKDWCPVRWTN